MRTTSRENNGGLCPGHSTARLSRLLKRLEKLTGEQLAEIEQHVLQLQRKDNKSGEQRRETARRSKDWPHAPLHRLAGQGTFIVTAATMNKVHHFRDAESLDVLEDALLGKSKDYGWQLEAWAVFSNHYHFVGRAMGGAESLRPLVSHVHAETARFVNERDGESGRRVWFNFWETELTYERSYFARLNYVHQNPVRHRVAAVANQYRWCSAAWFERTASPAQVKTIYSFKTDRIRVIDDFGILGVR
jgi:putative transposase